MLQFFLLELRRQWLMLAIDAATARLPDPQAEAWLAELNVELDGLAAAADEIKDDEAFRLAAVLWARTVADADALLAAIDADPVFLAAGRTTVVTPEVATVVVRTPNRRDRWGSVPGVSADMLDELYCAGYRWWFMLPEDQRPPLSDALPSSLDIGVLIPVQLETRFDEPTEEHPHWRLRLRVTPDDIWLARQRPLPSEVEMEALRQMQNVWYNTHPDAPLHQFLATAAGKSLWQALCDAFAPARAAWLVTDILVQNLDLVEAGDRGRDRRVIGFPTELEAWVVRKVDETLQPPQRLEPIERRAVDSAALTVALPKRMPQGDGLPATVEATWWNSWEGAQQVGLGMVFDLPGHPQEIETLYVIGLGDETPDELLTAKIRAGEFAVIATGEATNTVRGQPTVDPADDADTWLAIVQQTIEFREGGTPFRSAHGAAFTGDETALPPFPPFPIAPQDHGKINELLLWLLHPVLWGHSLKDIWGLGRDVYPFVQWLVESLAPQGHLLPIRVGAQPYGILPTTAHSRWMPHAVDRDQGVGGHVADVAGFICHDLARVARTRGTTVHADTEKLTRLVARTPTSTGYSYTTVVPAELVDRLSQGLPGWDPALFEDHLRELYQPVAGHAALRNTMAYGHLRDLDMPLILPRHFPGIKPEDADYLSVDERAERLIEYLDRLTGNLGSRLDIFVPEFSEGVLPDSLLVRLLIQSGLHVRADAAQAGLMNDPLQSEGPRLEPVTSGNDPLLWNLADRLTLEDIPAASIDLSDKPAALSYDLFAKGLERLKALLQDTRDRGAELEDFIAGMEQTFKHLLDSASTRVDPFLTALAWRRLQRLQELPDKRHRLGAYGWVETPWTGQHGPRAGGLLHAPSRQQAMTALILRDRYLSERELGAADNRWRMNVTSQRARLADALAEEVRLGMHPHEALGRRVEAIIDDEVTIRALREKHAPLRAAHPDRFTVCNGLAALELLLSNPPPVVLTPTQKDQLEELRGALDVYGDLLVAQGVYQAVAQRGEAASAAMDGAAGFLQPPDLSVIQTPRAGQSAGTSVLAALPYAPTPDAGDRESHPAVIADPSTAAHVESLFGGAAAWVWEFTIRTQTAIGAPEVITPGQATLADLGLEPIDAVLFSERILTELLAQVVLTQVDVGLAGPLVIGQTPSEVQEGGVMSFELFAAPGEPGEDQLPSQPLGSITVDGDGPHKQRRAQELVATLGGKPLEFGRLYVPATPQEQAAAAANDAAILADLQDRMDKLVAAATDLLANGLNDEAQAESGLRLALRWGILPVDRTAPPSERLANARLALGQRLDHARQFSARQAQDEANVNAQGRSPRYSVTQLAEAINELAAPNGNLAILSSTSAQSLARLEPEQPQQPDPALDEAWLTMVAPVRPRLARLEAYQLTALAGIDPTQVEGLTTYSNRPGDPWQRQAILANRQAVIDGRPLAPSRLVAVYGVPGLWDHQRLAVGVIDAWTETVPEQRHSTHAAFKFNVPGARPQQAVLLAVPPDLDQFMDTQAWLEVLMDTRELAHARTISLEDIGADPQHRRYQSVLPTIMLSVAGQGVELLDANPRPFWPIP